MSITVHQFAKTLAETGIMTAEELRMIQEAMDSGAAGENHPGGVLALAQELVRREKLTEYQARLLHGGGAGVTIGSYLILDEIGYGGMGRVYKAQHRRMKRTVALKVLSPSATLSQESIRRFQREVEAAAKLNHPNIVTAYDADEENGVHYLVMEYVDGNSLANVVSPEKPIPVATILDYVMQIANGLRYAHQQGIVHRDIKPGNLLLASNGTIKILDMGLARVENSPGASEDTGAQKLTQAGQIMGTIDFMSPEQAEDTRQADARADIYSLGCTLYFLLTGGDVPYHGDTVMRRLLAHRSHPIPSLSEKRADVPKYLDAVFRSMVAKLPEERYQSMDELILQLETSQATMQQARPGSSGILKHGPGSGILSRGNRPVPTGGAHSPLSDSNVLSQAGVEGAEEVSPRVKPPSSKKPAPKVSEPEEEYMLQEDADRLKASKASQPPSTADAIRTTCACGRQLVVKADLLGKKVKCPQCGGAVTISKPDSSSSLAPSIDVVCQCGSRFAAKPKLAGKTVRCSKCGRALKIPAATASAPPASTAVPSAEKIEVTCGCGKRLKAGRELAGKSVKCPTCSAAVKIPRVP